MKLNKKEMELTKSLTSKHFDIIPNRIGNININNNRRLKDSDKRALGLVYTFNRLGMVLYMSDTNMASALGMSRSTLIRSINSLKKLHLIKVIPVNNKNGHTIGKEVNLNFVYLTKNFKPIHRHHFSNKKDYQDHSHNHYIYKKHSTFRNDMIYLLRKLLRRLEK